MPFPADYLTYVGYLLPLGIVYFVYLRRTKRRHRQNLSTLRAAIDAGLTEPVSLHPLIDPNRCLGSAACLAACPEGDVLGLIAGKAELVNPSHCIGHGACKAACPHDAITLVFGTEKRGVDIPHVTPSFETNVPGLFIAGELGGMGLIRNAIEQGRQAMESIRKRARGKHAHDVVIVGAGPAGFSASLAALQHRLRFVTIEQEDLGGTVVHFPRGKIVMTQPATLPIVGKVKIRETSKEALLQFWQGVAHKTGVKINYRERMEGVVRQGNSFLVKTTRGTYETAAVLLAIGRRGTPRKLGVPGEQLAKVVYHLIDPQQYRNQHVLVVGGGDAALEAASSIADEPGAKVTLSYRDNAFSRAKQKNRDKVEELCKQGRLRVLLTSNVRSIAEKNVLLEQKGDSVELLNDAVIICAGGVLPTPFLKSLGIHLETKHGTV